MSPASFSTSSTWSNVNSEPVSPGRAVDLDDGAGRDLELAAAGLNNRVHGRFLDLMRSVVGQERTSTKDLA